MFTNRFIQSLYITYFKLNTIYNATLKELWKGKKLEGSVLEYAIHYITECPLGTFGNNCRRECGYCEEKYHCHHINGSCLNGCLHGYRGEQCKHRKYFQINILYLNKNV